MIKLINKSLYLAAAASITATAIANHHEEDHSHHSPTVAADSLFTSSFLGNFNATNDKIQSLGDAFSDDQLEWAPSEGVRSGRESILHVAAANYFLGSMLGAKMPEGVDPRSFESTVTGKNSTLKTHADSVAFVESAIKGLSEESLAEMTNFFGSEKSKMAVVMIVGAHADEHLGQLIAYARSNSIVPPWSQ